MALVVVGAGRHADVTMAVPVRTYDFFQDKTDLKAEYKAFTDSIDPTRVNPAKNGELYKFLDPIEVVIKNIPLTAPKKKFEKTDGIDGNMIQDFSQLITCMWGDAPIQLLSAFEHAFEVKKPGLWEKMSNYTGNTSHKKMAVWWMPKEQCRHHICNNSAVDRSNINTTNYDNPELVVQILNNYCKLMLVNECVMQGLNYDTASFKDFWVEFNKSYCNMENHTGSWMTQFNGDEMFVVNWKIVILGISFHKFGFTFECSSNHIGIFNVAKGNVYTEDELMIQKIAFEDFYKTATYKPIPMPVATIGPRKVYNIMEMDKRLCIEDVTDNAYDEDDNATVVSGPTSTLVPYHKRRATNQQQNYHGYPKIRRTLVHHVSTNIK